MAKDGDGTAVIDFNGTSGRVIEVVCGSVGTWTITYTVPDGGMAAGGGIKIFRVPNKYWLGQCKQIENPKALDYLTCKRSDGSRIEFSYIGRFYKDHHEASVRITDSPMRAGEKITVVFGDRSGGSPGAIVPFSWQPPCEFWVESDLDGDGKFGRLSEPLVVKPIAGPVAKFVVDIPLVCRVGEKVKLRLRAEDRSSNVVESFSGKVKLSCTDAEAIFPETATFRKEAHGVASVDIIFRSPGIHYVTAKQIDGTASGSSNPTKVSKTEPAYRIYWGDLHCHTEESDGTGSLDFNYRYARDVSWLDFVGVTDHLIWNEKHEPIVQTDGPISRSLDEWNNLQSAAAHKYYTPGSFVTFLGYEWSASSERGGDHNVYYLDDRARIGCHFDLTDEFKDLRSRGEKAAFIIPHVGGRIADSKWFDPIVEPSVEINSMHDHFEWFAQEYLQKGYKVGFNGGSDGHFGLPGNDIWPNHGRLGLERRDTSVPQGITCVYAPKLTREAIRDAFFARRTYAATGVKILLEVTMDGRMMGEEYSSSKPPVMRIRAAGTSDIARIEVIRNKERILNHKATGKVVDLEFKDEEPITGTSYYYVRLSQNDGEIAWSSPIFFTYTGPPIQPKRPSIPWNYESAEDEPGDPVNKDYLPELMDHLSWRAPGHFVDLKQVRMVHSSRGDYALFYGIDSKTGNRIHIRWYIGFDSPRIHTSVGWRDFGSIRG